jgi:cytochrome P450
VIAERRAARAAGGEARDDVLGRMLELQSDAGHRPWLDDDAICRNISGLIIGALETTNKSVVHVIDELLRRPEALRGARAAALAGDMAKVRGYAFEALRFNPFAPMVVRFCGKGASVGSHYVPAQKTVFAVTSSAMFDSAAVDHPNDFRPDRSIDYLHFGHGLHRCQGHLINGVQVPELAASVLRLKNLRRARGKDGRVTYVGPFPERFVVEFDPE